MDIRNSVLAVLCAGVPAPGVNGVISSVTIEALNSNCSVLGILEGFKQLKQGKSMVLSLDFDSVTRIYNKGGSILRTSKQQLKTIDEIDNCLRVLEHHRVRYLVTIGGTQTAYSASLLANAAKKCKYPLSVVHVPKTIFNDLPLPDGARTFGFSTAREVGSSLVNNFANDARTMLRWYILPIIGQSSGHLTLGIGKSAAATLTLIPEEFKFRPKKLTFLELASILEAAIYKRKAMNKEYGVIVLSEGLVGCMEQKEVQEKWGTQDNAHQELGRSLQMELAERFKANGVDMTVVTRNVGNELRSSDPNAADIDLTRDLGYAATRFLIEGGSGCMIAIKGGSVLPIPLQEVVDIPNYSTQIREVDTSSLSYQVAQSYMISLKPADLQDSIFLQKLARAANLTPQLFLERFQSVAALHSATHAEIAQFQKATKTADNEEKAAEN